MRHVALLVPLCIFAACGDENFDALSCDDVDGTCKQFMPDEAKDLQSAVNSLKDKTTLVLAKGTFKLDNQLTIRAEGITLAGQGKGDTTLSFASQESQSNGVDVVGDDFTIKDLAVLDSKKDAVRVEDSTGVTMKNVKVDWSAGPSSDNGAYGLYPVRSRNVHIDGCEAHSASDAGIYVGQVQHAIVENSTASGNVAGIEIENTQYADVHDNTSEDNTGGLLIFDLPGNPIIGHDIRVHGNTVKNNNRENFAPGGVVTNVPTGTGTFAMASRRVEIFDNTYADNHTTDIAVVSGLVIEDDVSLWVIPAASLVGDTERIDVMQTEAGDYMNFRSQEIYLHGNSHSGFGTDPDSTTPLGTLLYVVYLSSGPVDAILYDGIGESSVDPENAENNSNDNHVCLHEESGATFATTNIAVLSESFDLADAYRPAAPFTPFDCDGLTGGPVASVSF